MPALLLIAWVFSLANTAYHLGAGTIDLGFWLNLVLVVAIPFVGIATSRENR